MHKIFTPICLLLSLGLNLFAQSQKEWLEEVKENFDDVKLVINTSSTVITFKNSKYGSPYAEVAESYVFESLQSNDFEESYMIFYDDNKSVEDIVMDDKKSNYYKSSYYDYSGDGIFHSDVKVVRIPLRFSKLGEVHTLNYSITVNDIRYLTQHYFNKSFACKSSSLKVIIPKDFDVELREFNLPSNVTKSITQEGGNSVYKYALEQLDPWHNESNIDGPTYIYPHILVLPKSYTRNDKKEIVFETVGDLYSWYKGLVDEMNNDAESLKEKVDELVLDQESDLDKIRSIFYWVQDNVRYIAFEDGIAGFKPEVCQNVFNNKYGDCKGMANLTSEMLKLAGFDARLTWLGTRRIAYPSDLQSLAVNNHMICAVMLNDEILFLDPTIKFSEMGLYPIGLQEQDVIIEDGENFLREKIPSINPLSNKEEIEISLSIADNEMVGTSKFKAVGENKMSFLAATNYVEKDDLDRGLNGILSRSRKTNIVDNIMIKNIKDKDQPIEIDYNIRIQNAISIFGDEVYIEIDPFKDYDKSEFDEKRKFDYTVNSRRVEVTKIKLKIPSDLLVSYLPEAFEVNEDEFKLSINYSKKDNEIIYIKKVEFSAFKISRKNFEKWNEAIKSLKDHHREQIILNKI